MTARLPVQRTACSHTTWNIFMKMYVDPAHHLCLYLPFIVPIRH